MRVITAIILMVLAGVFFSGDWPMIGLGCATSALAVIAYGKTDSIEDFYTGCFSIAILGGIVSLVRGLFS